LLGLVHTKVLDSANSNIQVIETGHVSSFCLINHMLDYFLNSNF